jgi:hypothetical protein
MPYIKQERRREFDKCLSNIGVRLQNKGELNYCFTMLCKWYISRHGQNYQNLSDCGAALIDARDEWYRREVIPYEDKKIEENGDCEL